MSSSNTIKTRIALEGGQEVKSTFQTLGQTARETGEQVRQAGHGLREAWGQAREGVKAAREAIGGVAGSVRQAGGEMAQAGEITEREVRTAARNIGMVLDESVEKQVQKHQDSLRLLKDSGQLSAEELARATTATEDKISRLYAKIGRESKQSVPLIERLGNAFRDLGRRVEATQKAWGNFSRSLTDLGGATRTFARNIALAKGAVVGLGAAATGLANSAAGAADAHIKAARAAGVAVESYGRLTFAASQSGVETSALDGALARLNRTAYEASIGNKNAVDQFRRLGVQVVDTRGRLRSTEAILQDVAQVFRRMPNGVQKSALAVQLFGRSGAQMISMLNEGRNGLRALGAQADALGITFTAQQARMAETYNDTMARMRQAFVGVKNSVGMVFIPALTEAASFIQHFVTSYRQAITEFVAGHWETVVGVMRDLMAMVRGQDGRVKNTWLLEARDQVVEFGASVRQAITGIVIPAFQGFMRLMGTLAQGINAIFGTDFSAQSVAIALAIAQISGALGVLTAALNVARTAWLVMWAAAGGPVTLIIAGLAAIGVLFYIFWDEIKALAGDAWDWIVEGAESAWESIGDAATDFIETWKVGAQSLVEDLVAPFRQAADWISDIWDGVLSMIQRVIDLARRAAGAVGIGGGNREAPAATPGYAGGGVVRGPGGPTSDSVLARLSAGEFVVQARAVRQYGLALMEALNQGRLQLPGFADGGMVQAFGRALAMPDLAPVGPDLAALSSGVGTSSGGSGGGGGSTLYLTLGGQQVAVPTTEDALQRLADAGRKQIATAPRWKR